MPLPEPVFIPDDIPTGVTGDGQIEIHVTSIFLFETTSHNHNTDGLLSAPWVLKPQ